MLISLLWHRLLDWIRFSYFWYAFNQQLLEVLFTQVLPFVCLDLYFWLLLYLMQVASWLHEHSNHLGCLHCYCWWDCWCDRFKEKKQTISCQSSHCYSFGAAYLYCWWLWFSLMGMYALLGALSFLINCLYHASQHCWNKNFDEKNLLLTSFKESWALNENWLDFFDCIVDSSSQLFGSYSDNRTSAQSDQTVCRKKRHYTVINQVYKVK